MSSFFPVFFLTNEAADSPPHAPAAHFSAPEKHRKPPLGTSDKPTIRTTKESPKKTPQNAQKWPFSSVAKAFFITFGHF
jgi:hypothetical protein